MRRSTMVEILTWNVKMLPGLLGGGRADEDRAVKQS